MISKLEQKKLKEYLQLRIPQLYKSLDKKYSTILNKDGEIAFDLMYCYEEIFYYSHSLIDRIQISKSKNFIDVPAEIFKEGFVDNILKLGEAYPELDHFCRQTISVYKIIQKYTQ